MSKLRSLLSRFFAFIFGTFDWDPPPWLEAVGRGMGRFLRGLRSLHFGQIMALVVGVSALGSLGTWLALRPRPPEPLRATLTAYAPNPPPPRKGRDPVPAPEPARLVFDQSVAAMELVGKPVTAGISIKPQVAGAWQWVSDRELVFTPEAHWPVGVTYDVHVARPAIAPQAKLANDDCEIATQPFKATINDFSFQQDPVDPDGKYVFGTIAFNYPVQRTDFESRVVAELVDPKSGKTTPLELTVSYDDLRFEAYVKSAAISTPNDDLVARLIVRGGVRAEAGGDAAKEPQQQETRVPGRYGVFSISDASATVVRDEKFDPEIVLIVGTASGIDEKKIAKAVQVVELPANKPGEDGDEPIKNYAWSNAGEVSKDVVKKSPKVNLTPVPAEREITTQHTFKLASVGTQQRDITPGRYLLVRIPKGLEAHGGYIAKDDFETIVRVPRYPQEVRIMHEGALLSVAGDKRLNVMVRGVPSVKIELARVLPGELNHVISMTSGPFATASFNNYRFDEQNVSEIFSEIRDLDTNNPRIAQYTVLDFSQRVQPQQGGRRGLFIVKVTAWDKEKNAPADLTTTYQTVGGDQGDGDEGEEDSERYGSDESDYESPAAYDQAADRRFVLVSDLGLLVKTDPQKNAKVFVQSIARGEPVDGATVEVIGKNGLPIVSRRTDGGGIADIPALTGFKNEETPIAWVVRDGGDLAFMAMDRDDRELDMSRFEVGGVRTKGNADALTAYAFSDRGIYRPGDTFHAAFMVKPVDWSKPVAGVPLQLVVVDPRGIEVKKQKLALPASGFIELAYTTFETAPTGDYTVNAYIVNDKRGNALLGSVSVRVEEFLPDRLRIETRIGDGKLGGWMAPEDLAAHIGLYNLFGTAAAEHRVAANMYLSPQAVSFAAFKDYAFTDPAAADESYEESLSECTTDGDGHCDFALDLKRFAGSSYMVSVYATGFELDGGRGVSGSARALVSPRPYFVGVKREGDLAFVNKDGEVGVRFIAVDKNVKAVDVEELRAVRIEERYVSVLQRQNNGSFAYQSVRKEITRGEEKLAIKAAGTRMKLDTREPGTFIVSVRDKRDLEVSRVRYSVQGEANLSRSVERNAELELVLDKRDYATGEPINVAIKAPYAGSGLITIERDKVYAHKWFKTGTNATVQTITLPAGLEGNGYVSVAFTRDSESPEIFMSPLSYGVVGFSVSQKTRTVAIQLDSPELVKPGDKLNVRYSADRPTKMVVWGVDEGILQVARYETPTPLAFFFEKRALEVRTKQILDLILPEHHVVAALMKQGGDGDGGASKNLNPFRRKHDAPVAFWSGIIDAGTESKTFTYQVPDTFNGTMRVMAAALAPDAVGVAQKKTTVRGPFVISPNAPLFIAPGDTAEISVAVANNVEGSGKDAKVEVALQAGDGVKVMGEASQTVTIPEGRESAVRWKLQGTTKLGAATLKLTARSGSASATLTTDTSVRPASAFASQVLSGIVASGSVDVPLARRLLPEYAKHEVTVSSAPLALARALQTYVENFPHLCTEQVVSAAVPSLLLRQYPELASKTKHSKPIVENALDVLQSRQNDDGSFGYWTASSRVSDYASLYATHFMLEATERGLPVPAELKKRALANARELARRPLAAMSSARLRAFAVYLLARAGEHSARELAELRDFLRKDQSGAWKSDITVAFLAAAYRLARDESEASVLIRTAELAREVPRDPGTLYDEQTYAAQLFYLLALHFPERIADFDKRLIERLVQSAGSGRGNTIGSAWTLYAFAAYARSDAAKSATGKATVTATADSGAKQPLTLLGASFPTSELALDTKNLRITNDSDLPLFYAITVSGFDREPATTAETRGIEIIRSFEDDKGKTLTEVPLGETVNVHVKMRAIEGTVHDAAVVELLPAGFDLVLDGSGGRVMTPASTWQPEYVDAREDRAVFYGDITKDMKEVVYRLRATTRGTFIVPPTHASAMYVPEVRGSAARGSIAVVGQ